MKQEQPVPKVAVVAAQVEPRAMISTYPEPFAAMVAGRRKRVLGELFGLRNFGVNLTRLAPGTLSSLHHRHSRQDEFVFILEGEPTLVTDESETLLVPGMCAGFAAGGVTHHLENRTDWDVVLLEVGDRSQGDEVEYPNDDLMLVRNETSGRRSFARKDGTLY